jgi:hypothetical protein
MDNFNWKTYIENYEDLQKANINTKEKAWTHWIKYGWKEGRTPIKLSNICSNLINTSDAKKNLVIIACHTNTNMKYTVLKNNIKYFEKDNIDIVLVNSIECEKNYDYVISNKIIDKLFVNNNMLIDFGKWIYVLENKYYIKNYDNIIFTNDSYIVTDKLDEYLNNMRKYNCDLYGYNDSNEIKYHYQSYLFTVKTKKIGNLINLFYDNLHKINSIYSVIIFLEINLINYFDNKDCYLKMTHLTQGKNIFFVCDNIYKKLLNDGSLPFIKIKRLFFLDNEKIIIPEFLLNSLPKNLMIA